MKMNVDKIDVMLIGKADVLDGAYLLILDLVTLV